MRMTARSVVGSSPTSCAVSLLPLLRATMSEDAPLTTWSLVTISPLLSIITPEPNDSPWLVVPSISTTTGSICAMAASCVDSSALRLSLDDEVGGEAHVPVDGWGKVQPEKRRAPRTTASEQG